MENSDQPQSRQTITSGGGFMGGWLRVLGRFRYKRISAGMMVRASDSHFGQATTHLWKGMFQGLQSAETTCGKVNSNRNLCTFSTINIEIVTVFDRFSQTYTYLLSCYQNRFHSFSASEDPVEARYLNDPQAHSHEADCASICKKVWRCGLKQDPKPRLRKLIFQLAARAWDLVNVGRDNREDDCLAPGRRIA